MKFQKQEKTFSPITITIESVEELKFLWHRMNLGLQGPTAYNTLGDDKLRANERDLRFSGDFWHEVEDILVDLGEKK